MAISNSTLTQVVTTPTPNLGANLVAPREVTVGINFNYTVHVFNDGGAPTSAPMTATIILPAGVSYVATGSGGDDWICSAVGQTVTATRTTVLGPYSTSQFSIPVHPSTIGLIIGNATITGG